MFIVMSFPEAEADRRKLIAFRHRAKHTISMSKGVHDFAVQMKKNPKPSGDQTGAANTEV